MNNWIILLAALFLIAFEATYEGVKTRGKHLFSEIVELVYLTVITGVFLSWITAVPSIFDPDPAPFWKVIGGYILLRIGIFDMIWNISAGQSISYIGITKLSDKFYQKLKTLWGMSPIWMIRGIAFVISLAWLLNYKQ